MRALDAYLVASHNAADHADGIPKDRAIGGIRRARLVAASQPPPSNDEIRMDLAVLEIPPVGAHPSLRIGTTPPKLSTAYVAGFPGFITQRDVDFEAALKTAMSLPHQ